jgi:hypothetical protein
MQQAFSMFGLGERESAGKEDVNTCAWRFYVQVTWYFYVHILSITSTCTSTCALHDKPRFDWEDDFNFIVYVIHTINFDIP